MEHQIDDIAERAKWPAMKRGFKQTCPHCADAPLFRAYLKQVDHCASCGEAWGDVRADDGPAWATMLVVGHVLAPFFHYLLFKADLPTWAPALILSAIAIALSLYLLPRMKGLWIGLLWATQAPN